MRFWGKIIIFSPQNLNIRYSHSLFSDIVWSFLKLCWCWGISVHTSSRLAPLSMSKAANSTCPPQAARVRGDSKESAGMLTCAPLSNSSRATSTWPSWDSETHKECRDKHLNKYVASFFTANLFLMHLYKSQCLDSKLHSQKHHHK